MSTCLKSQKQFIQEVQALIRSAAEKHSITVYTQMAESSGCKVGDSLLECIEFSVYHGQMPTEDDVRKLEGLPRETLN